MDTFKVIIKCINCYNTKLCLIFRDIIMHFIIESKLSSLSNNPKSPNKSCL